MHDQLIHNLKKTKGWHYGWIGSKHTSEVEHAFLVYVCVPYGLNFLQVLAAFKSPRFTMFCRRRHNTVKEEEKIARAKSLEATELVTSMPLLPSWFFVSKEEMRVLPNPADAHTYMERWHSGRC